MFIFRGARNVSWTSNMCSRNPLVIFFGRVASVSPWSGANFEIVRTTLVSLCACQIALVVREILCRDLATVYRDLAKRSLTKILPRELF